MTAEIFKPTKTAMQSGKANTKLWMLRYDLDDDEDSDVYVEPLMGWTGSNDTRRQVRLKFPTKEAAIAYAERNGIAYKVTEPETSKKPLRAYADNFTRPID